MLARPLTLSLLLAMPAIAHAENLRIVFTPDHVAQQFEVAKLPAPLPTDWSDAHFLVLEMRATSPERFQLELHTPDGTVSKRISPFQNTWVRASVPLEFFRKPAREGFDLAATYNKHRDSYWININFGGTAPCTTVSAIGFRMDSPYPMDGQPPALEIRSIALAKTDPGDAVLDPRVVVDAFGQWIPAQWPGKAESLEGLQKDWRSEARTLKPGEFGYDNFGGYADTSAKATGFFRVEQIDGKWWFVDPEGHLFFSAGANGIGTSNPTPAANRRGIFESIPEPPPTTSPAAGGAAQSRPGGRGRGAGIAGGSGSNPSFYSENLRKRFGANFIEPWGQLTFRRLDAWGLNTVAGFGSTPPAAIALDGRRKPYTIMLRGWQGGPNASTIMGMPDVYSEAFAAQADRIAAQLCAPNRDDSYLLGYFVGNEPPWPGRESLFCDAILQGPDSGLKTHLADFLKQGDTPERRKQFAFDAFDRFLAVIDAAVKKADPHHLNLGIRLGGEVPDEVIKACRVFDVCSLNVYDFAVGQKTLDRFATLTGRPLLIGEFHFGTPGRGMSGGLRQVASQAARGQAYQYYVEQAARHPSLIGAHWFQWIDQPATGRFDGENYNIGFVDVTDRPYREMVAALVRTHERLERVHSGEFAATDTMPEGASTAEIRPCCAAEAG